RGFFSCEIAICVLKLHNHSGERSFFKKEKGEEEEERIKCVLWRNTPVICLAKKKMKEAKIQSRITFSGMKAASLRAVI
ncbi:hypothetical protein E2320_003592, partial [Naja naja]